MKLAYYKQKCIYLLLFLLIILPFIPVSLRAQDVSVFTSKQGLVNSCVQALYEDSRHNIWIGTRNGLSRYDGVKMNTYRHSDKNPHSLVHNLVLCFYEYDKDNILIGTDAGLQSYSYATDKFTNVPLIINGDTTIAHIASICKVSDNQIFACTPGTNGYYVKEEKGRLVAIHSSDYVTGANNYTPSSICKDNDGNLWVINSNYEVYRKQGKGFRKYDVVGRPTNFAISSSGRLYLGSLEGGLLIYNKKSDSFIPVCPEQHSYNLSRIKAWTNGRLLISTDGFGLKIYDENTRQLTQSTIQASDFNLATSNVKDAICDKYGNVWIGIYWRGVMKKSFNQYAFEYIGRHSITKNTIGTNPITAMAAFHNSEQSGLWVATDHNGLYKVTADGTSSYHWDPSAGSNVPYTINAICEDGNGKLWLGGFSDGLWSMDIHTGMLSRSPGSVNRIFSIVRDHAGNLWIATVGDGFHRYNPLTHEDIRYINGDNNILTENLFTPNRYVFSIFEHGNILYAGTADGLEIYSLSGNQPKALKRVVSGKNILAMRYDGKHTLWLATNNGLVCFDINNYSIKEYNEAEGLPNPVVNSIEIMGRHLWLGTDNGLSCFDVKTGTFETFYNEDGVQDNEFGQRVSAIIDERLYFGGISGVTYFRETDIANRTVGETFRMEFVDFYLNSTPVHTDDLSDSYNILDSCINEAKLIQLAYDDNQFSIEVNAPTMEGYHVVYEYSFNGKDWMQQSEGGNRIFFQGLDPGTYEIYFRARANQTVSEVRALTITIHHPWYTSPLAIIVYILLIALVLWMLVSQAKRQYAARKVLQKHRQEKEINEARIQFFMNISHEIRTPMTLIMAPLEKLISSDRDEERQRNYKLIHLNAKRILRLVNQLMDVRKIEKGQYTLDYKAVELVGFIQGIYDVFASAAQKRNISFEFNHVGIGSLFVKADPENLDKILMNLLSNAFKFTPDGGRINVSLSATDKDLLLSVVDNGVGIKDEDKPKIFERFYSAQHQNGYIGTGIGLNLTYLLVQLHKGSIQVLDNPEGSGSKFEIQLPRIDVKQTEESAVTEEYITTVETEMADVNIEKTRGLRHRNVLIVEDDTAIRQYLHGELSRYMVITECNNGEEALNYILKNPQKVDLVISDRMMPVMDGLTLCQKIKQNPLVNHIPVILMTALGSDTDRIDGLSGGADAYISKPFNIDVLRTTALNLIQSRQMLQGKYATEQKTEEGIEKVELVSPDENLMERVMKVINKNMDNSDLSIEMFADLVGISRVHFYRKMKELTGQSPRDFLKTVRLKEAARLLRDKKLDITAVSDATGFKTLSTFSTSFKAMYGMTPSEYAKDDEA